MNAAPLWNNLLLQAINCSTPGPRDDLLTELTKGGADRNKSLYPNGNTGLLLAFSGVSRAIPPTVGLMDD